MQNVLITGANRGIGLAFVRHYLARGARVIATCRHPHNARELLSLQESHSDSLNIVPLDVTSEAQLERAFQQIAHFADGLDILINNAGILRPTQHFQEITSQDFLDMLNVNTIAPLRVIQIFLPLLEQRPTAKIVNLTAPIPALDVLTRRQSNHTLLASRSALNMLTRLLAFELEATGIIIVALWPGFIQTDMNGMASAATPSDKAIPGVIDFIEQLNREHSGHGLRPDGSTFF